MVGSISTGDAVIQGEPAFLDEATRDESFKDVDISESRVDAFLHEKVSVRYPQLWGVCEMILIISHGQATVERGFSVNKEVEICKMQEGTVSAHRLICDYVTVCNVGKRAAPSANGLGYDIVMELSEMYQYQRRHLYFDNLFSSIKLLRDQEEQQTYACVTIRSNRAGYPLVVKQPGRLARGSRVKR